MLSFLRARPNCGSAYHESKWAAEEIIRRSGLSYTVIKSGVIYGRGDHLLDHLSRAFHTFPVFGLVGLRREAKRLIAPVAVDDVATLLVAAALRDPRLGDRTVYALGPELLHLDDAIRRVGDVVGRRPVFVRLPLLAHGLLAYFEELVMVTPLLAVAQVRILDEGVVVPAPFADPPPDDLRPRTPFSAESIRAGLPPPEGFGLRDLRFGSRRRP
jgi:NADH dehydrogenase